MAIFYNNRSIGLSIILLLSLSFFIHGLVRLYEVKNHKASSDCVLSKKFYKAKLTTGITHGSKTYFFKYFSN